MNMDLDTKHFLACIECGKVVMGKQTHTKNKNKKEKEKSKLMASSDSGEYRLMVTLCHTCDPMDKIRGAVDLEGVMLHINKRMIKTWCVYLALIVGGSIKMDEYGDGKVQVINRGEFVHSANNTYELTTIKIDPDKPEDETTVMCSHLVTGFF